MLRHLRVTNFAILSDVAMDLRQGFNALTGETGAGKSLIVEAVNLLRGGRASADIPRAGADQATVEAIFEVPADLGARVRSVLESAGLPESGSEVLVRRVIHRGGRSRTYVNGALTTARRLAELGALMVDLSGQHQHQGLTDPRRHREILDAFAKNESLLETMAAAYHTLSEAERAIEALAGDPRALQERVDYLRFQLEELERAELCPGQDEELEAKRVRLAAMDRLRSAADKAEFLVYSERGAAVDRLGRATRELDKVADIEPTLAAISRQLDEARILAEDAGTQLGHYVESSRGEPHRLAEIEDRLAQIKRLARKHGGTVESAIARTEELREEVHALEHREERLEALERERARAEERAREAARALRASRTRAADHLCHEVCGVLTQLGMGAAQLSVRIDDGPLGPDGADKVELMLASNLGEDEKPLARVASGGELSRIMLSLKLCLRRADEVATYVFDEVDTGIGGATAEVVGRLIRELGDQRQVVCVTHLPQIVAFADEHFHVSKFESGGRTETEVRTLDMNERREEIARMLGGVEVTESARAHAQTMLDAASAAHQADIAPTPDPTPGKAPDQKPGKTRGKNPRKSRAVRGEPSARASIGLADRVKLHSCKQFEA